MVARTIKSSSYEGVCSNSLFTCVGFKKLRNTTGPINIALCYISPSESCSQIIMNHENVWALHF